MKRKCKELIAVITNNLLLDFVFVKLSPLDFLEVPCDNVLSCRSDNSILRLALSLIEPRIEKNVNEKNSINKAILAYLAGEKEMSWFI